MIPTDGHRTPHKTETTPQTSSAVRIPEHGIRCNRQLRERNRPGSRRDANRKNDNNFRIAINFCNFTGSY